MREINYEEYKSMLESKETFILDLYLEACVPCQQMIPVLQELDIPGVSVLKMDILQNRRIYHELSLKTAPTLIYFKDGVEIKRSIGLQEKDGILALVA